MQDGTNNEPGWVFKPGDELEQATPQPVVNPTQHPVLPPVQAPVPEGRDDTQIANPIPEPQAASFSQQETSPESMQDINYPHIEWTASEYVSHQKSAGWYGLLAVASVGIAVIVYFVTSGDIISTIVVLVLGVLLGIFAARQPRELSYAMNERGLLIGQKFYPYDSFKTFSVVHDHGIGFISLEPLRRFMPPLTIHYDPNDEDKIAGTLAEYLPHEEHKPDIVDDLTRRFRF